MKIFFIIILGLCSDIHADLVYPENGLELNYTHIPFEWEQESEAKYYQLQIATDISFNDIIYDCFHEWTVIIAVCNRRENE